LKSLTTKPDLRYLEKLRRKAIRGRVWHRVPAERKAMIRAVEWALRRGDEFAENVKRSRRISTVLGLVTKTIEKALDLVRPPFRIRALLQGAEIARRRIATYMENGVFQWAPWAEGWLKNEETMVYLGATTGGPWCG